MPRLRYVYPEHLRGFAEDMPAAAGVYIFHGDDEQLPLYIGKSVNLRARVLSHLRNPREARMLRKSRRITHERTAGEVGALLLEARLVKERYPLLNRRLRRNFRLCSLRFAGKAPEIVYAQEVDFAVEPRLYGLFWSRRAALDLLESFADEERLCLGALGLEKLPRGRACFRSRIGRCSGVCEGAEPLANHQARLQARLDAHALACWSWPGALGLVERDEDGRTDIHVVRNWCHLGTAADLDAARALSRVTAGFDADCYRILARPLLHGSVELVPL